MSQVGLQHRKALCITILVIMFLMALIPGRSSAQAQLPSGPFPSGLGVNDHNTNETLAVLQQMYSIGIRWLRIDVTWPTVETTPGVYNFSAYDRLLANAAKAGIKMLFILDYTNPLYDNGYSPDDAAGINAFVAYALATVKHYHGKGIIWEIYNEPTEFWSTKGTTYTHWTDASAIAPLYYKLASATTTAIESAYPDEIVVGPADASFDSLLQPNGDNAYQFMVTLLRDGLGNHLDSISVHPYREGNPETATTDYTWLQGQIRDYTTTNPPTINSEWGYTSCYYNKNAGCVAAGEGGSLTYTQAEIQKADYVVRGVLTDLSSPVPIPVHMIYDWMDDGTDQGNPEDNYGLVQYYDTNQTRPAITPLPAYYAVRTLTRQLEGYTFVRRMLTSDNTDYILKFSNGRNTRYVCWNSSGHNNTVNIPIGSHVGITITGYDGNATGAVAIQKVTSGANGYSCAEQAYPQYISTSPSPRRWQHQQPRSRDRDF